MRARVLTAVVESIADVGYQRTTAAEIARYAGVTWGAVQHHFGDKGGILMAVLEESFSHFAECLADGPKAEAGLDERVDQFVDASWEHFSSPLYRSTFQILLNLPPDLEPTWQNTMLGEWTRVWSRYFLGGRAARRSDIDLMHYTISVLSGLAAMQMLEGPRRRRRGTELNFLKRTLREELAAG
jgi:AcrR family transcriptional regulator